MVNNIVYRRGAEMYKLASLSKCHEDFIILNFGVAE